MFEMIPVLNCDVALPLCTHEWYLITKILLVSSSTKNLTLPASDPALRVSKDVMMHTT